MNDTDQYCPILSENAQYCPILPNIVKYNEIFSISNKCCPILSCIAQYCSSDYFSSLLSEIWYCKEHSDIVQNCQIYPNIVRHWLILSSIDQYCPVTPCLDIFHFNHFKYFKCDLDAVKKLAICKYATLQVCRYESMQFCNKKWKLRCHFLTKQ